MKTGIFLMSACAIAAPCSAATAPVTGSSVQITKLAKNDRVVVRRKAAKGQAGVTHGQAAAVEPVTDKPPTSATPFAVLLGGSSSQPSQPAPKPKP